VDPSADGRRSAAIFATVELPSAGGISSRRPRGDTLHGTTCTGQSSSCTVNEALKWDKAREKPLMAQEHLIRTYIQGESKK